MVVRARQRALRRAIALFVLLVVCFVVSKPNDGKLAIYYRLPGVCVCVFSLKKGIFKGHETEDANRETGHVMSMNQPRSSGVEHCNGS